MKTITRDPVCGMDVDESSTLRVEHEGATYLFCSENCRKTFLQDPARFVEAQKETMETLAKVGRASGEKSRQQARGRKWTDYIPLLVIVGFTLLAASAKQIAYGGGWNWMTWMHDFMGFFLTVFSMFKFFDLGGFADGFQMYDLLAKPFRPYAFIYPFIELGLGLGYLAHWQPLAIYLVTVVVMVFGSLGVIRALVRGLDLKCACMGTILSVPLSTVALVEDLGMAAMAAAMLILTW
jgi:YHS domain-containing protein